METALQKEDKRLSTQILKHLFQNTKDAIYVYEISGKSISPFIAINRAAHEKLGYTYEELLSLTPFDISTSEAHAQIQTLYLQKENDTLTFSSRHIKKNGEAFPIHVTSRIVHIRNRKIVVSIVQDRSPAHEYIPSFLNDADEDETQHMPTSLQLQSRLQKALTMEELILYYQPRIDSNTNAIVGAEALIRWFHPEYGIIPPSDFIPVAEKSPTIIAIGNWVLHEVCQQINAWRQAGLPPISVSINLSARQLEDPSFVPTIQRILAEHAVDGKWIEFELTERTLVKESDIVIRNLHAIRAMGIRISIDDFGIGYSSLSSIHKFPVDSLKIDRTFVREIGRSPKSNLVSSIIALGQSLQLHVIAEGVETEQQLAFLRENGCSEWQGYLFSRPIPAAEFEELHRAKQ